MKTRRVEYLRAWEDGKWDTLVECVQYDHSLVEEQDIIAALTEWAYDNLWPELRHRDVVFFGVRYSSDVTLLQHEEGIVK